MLKGLPIDLALQALANQSRLYSRAQALRKEGKNPTHMGLADELPSRLAAEQLNTLAGMSQKVRLLDIFIGQRE